MPEPEDILDSPPRATPTGAAARVKFEGPVDALKQMMTTGAAPAAAPTAINPFATLADPDEEEELDPDEAEDWAFFNELEREGEKDAHRMTVHRIGPDGKEPFCGNYPFDRHFLDLIKRKHGSGDYVVSVRVKGRFLTGWKRREISIEADREEAGPAAAPAPFVMQMPPTAPPVTPDQVFEQIERTAALLQKASRGPAPAAPAEANPMTFFEQGFKLAEKMLDTRRQPPARTLQEQLAEFKAMQELLGGRRSLADELDELTRKDVLRKLRSILSPNSDETENPDGGNMWGFLTRLADDGSLQPFLLGLASSLAPGQAAPPRPVQQQQPAQPPAAPRRPLRRVAPVNNGNTPSATQTMTWEQIVLDLVKQVPPAETAAKLRAHASVVTKQMLEVGLTMDNNAIFELLKSAGGLTPAQIADLEGFAWREDWLTALKRELQEGGL